MGGVSPILGKTCYLCGGVVACESACPARASPKRTQSANIKCLLSPANIKCLLSPPNIKCLLGTISLLFPVPPVMESGSPQVDPAWQSAANMRLQL